MLVGKRAGAPIMTRTRSMSGMTTVNMQVNDVEVEGSDPENGIKVPHGSVAQTINDRHSPNPNPNGYDHDMMLVSPRPRMSANQIQNHLIHSAPQFLRSCGLCNRPLLPGRDIYMYRGDTAFCSLECREQLMKQEERKEKWKLATHSEKQDQHSFTSASNTFSSQTQTLASALT